MLIRLSGKEGERKGRQREKEIENIGEKRKKEINRKERRGERREGCNDVYKENSEVLNQGWEGLFIGRLVASR